MTIDRKQLTARERLVFPLDVPDWESAKKFIQILGDRVGYFKIGLELFISAGPSAVLEAKEMTQGRSRIFLDLKLHDIPATVGRAAASAARLGADLLTVHAGDGREMMRAAKKAAGETRILAVTVLTSLDLKEELGLAPEYTEPLALVLLRAKLALEAGCDGFVCAGPEAAAVRKLGGPDPIIVCPGIRPEWSLVPGDDQSRVVTPAKAIGAGADLLVIGRPIRDAEDPAKAARMVAEEIEEALT